MPISEKLTTNVTNFLTNGVVWPSAVSRPPEPSSIEAQLLREAVRSAASPRAQPDLSPVNVVPSFAFEKRFPQKRRVTKASWSK